MWQYQTHAVAVNVWKRKPQQIIDHECASVKYTESAAAHQRKRKFQAQTVVATYPESWAWWCISAADLHNV